MGIAIGMPCCEYQLCPNGETSWFDDFSSYSPGEDLVPYGYSTDTGSAIESNGSMLVNAISEDLSRFQAFDPNLKDIATVTIRFDRLRDIPLFNSPDMRLHDHILRLRSDRIIIRHTDTNGNFVTTVLQIIPVDGDTYKMEAVKRQVIEENGKLGADFDFTVWRNGAIIHTAISQLLLIANVWCAASSGVRGTGILIGLWEFSTT